MCGPAQPHMYRWFIRKLLFRVTSISERYAFIIIHDDAQVRAQMIQLQKGVQIAQNQNTLKRTVRDFDERVTAVKKISSNDAVGRQN